MASKPGVRSNVPVIRTEVEMPQSIPDSAPEADKPSFWELVHCITPDQWERNHIAYLYREKPLGENKRPALVQKITHDFDEAWVAETYGGYDWKVLLNGPGGKMVASHYFSVAAPPKGVLQEPAGAQTSATPAAPANGANDQLVKLLGDLVGGLREEIRSMRTAAVNPAAGNDVVLTGAVDMLKSLIPQQKDPLELVAKLKEVAGGGSGIMDKVFLLLVDKLLTQPSAPAAGDGSAFGLLDQVDKLMAVAEKLGARGARSASPSIAAMLVDKAPEIMDKAVGMMDRWKAIAEQNALASQFRYAAATAIANGQRLPLPANQHGAPAMPAMPAVAPRVPATRPAEHAAAAGASGIGLEVEAIGGNLPTPAQAEDMGSAAGHSAGAALAGADAARLNVLAFTAERIVNAIARGDEGGKIVDFIEMVDENWLATLQGVTVDGLDAFFNSDPILKHATTMPRYRQVLQEIVEAMNEEAGPLVN